MKAPPNKIEEIDHTEDTLEVYFFDIAIPHIIQKEDLFQWLYDTDSLSWAEWPRSIEEVDTVKSGTFTMEQYFDQPKLIIEQAVTKYLDAIVF